MLMPNDPDSFDKIPSAPAKPTITEKEVSWYEAVAAEKARREAQTQDAASQARVTAALHAVRAERVNVAGFMLEPYSLAHSLLLEQLQHPLEVGGTMTTIDIAVGVIVFEQREECELIVDRHGPTKAREMLLKSPEIRATLARIGRPQLAEFTAWIRAQLGSPEPAAGEPGGK